jgi:type II secretion system protein N
MAFDVALWDGRIHGVADLSGETRALEVAVDGVDLARALPLRRASGLDLVGKVTGRADLTLPGTPQGKIGGTVEAGVGGAGISGGSVPVPGMTGGLPVPKLALGDVTAKVKVDQGKASFQQLETRGGDAELTGEDVFLVLMPRLGASPLGGRLRLRIRDAFWTQSGMQGFKGIAEAAMATGRSGDGSYSFQLSGTLDHPAARPGGAAGPRPGAPSGGVTE